MQELYLTDLGNTKPNVASDVATPVSDPPIEEKNEESTQTLSPKKGESTVVDENAVPNTTSEEEDAADVQNIQIARDALNSLGESSSGAKAVPDASASLAHDQPQDTNTDVVDDLNVQQKDKTDHVLDDGGNDPDNVVADDNPHQIETATGEIHSDNVMSENLVHVNAEDDIAGDSTEDDVTIMKIVGDSRKKAGKSGVGRRLRERKETVTEVMAEEPKSTKKKKNVAVEATTPSKKKKVATEATTSTKKKKMYGPLRRSSRVEIPSMQKKQGSKRKTINLSDSDSDAEENAPPISTASKQKTPKKRKTASTTTAEDAEVNAPGIVSTQKKKAGRSIPQNVPDVPMDNVSFHFPTSAAKWKFVYHRRLAIERELAEDTLECIEVMELIKQAGLLKRESPLTLSYKLFDGKHAADIIVPPKKVVAQESAASTSMNRKAMIISMEATVKALDAQKLELEKVIFALKQEEAEEEGLVAENAGENAAGAGVDVTAGNATVNADDAADGDAADNVDVDAGGDTEELEVSDSSGSF
ncbi:hypothetical protein QL285_057393 [Trifolium repens]|nr:hypothetical protein QL285_057393 [Trifolium repens]